MLDNAYICLGCGWQRPLGKECCDVKQGRIPLTPWDQPEASWMSPPTGCVNTTAHPAGAVVVAPVTRDVDGTDDYPTLQITETETEKYPHERSYSRRQRRYIGFDMSLHRVSV